jgi:Cu(I)/Ag(I) efflux system membrane fusion protein
VVKVVELRLRFIALMAITGLVFAYWDTIWNRIDKWRRPAAEQVSAQSNVEFYCPMHPQVVQGEPGTCPICGMPLARRKKGEKAPLAPGTLSRVELAPFRVAQAGVRTVDIAYAPLTQTFTTVGTVAFDERRLANITARVPGKTRVEELHVNITGQGVEVGQTLAELYSPELSQAIQELLNAARRAQSGLQPKSDVARSLVNDRQELVRSSTEKLRRWGITEEQIEEILKSGKSDFKFPILSPIRGTVVRKNVVEGQEVQEGYPMFEVADLHTVWVKAQVYERQLGLIHLGQPVEASVEAFPGKLFPGKVEFIQPNVDPATRTIEVRYALDNPGLRLRPGMFATVVLETAIADTPEFQTRFAGRRPRGTVLRVGHMLAEEQRICPVTDAELGTMGPPIAVEVDGKTIWTCCDACPSKVSAEPAKYLAKLTSLLPPVSAAPGEALTPEQQKTCPVTGLKLGSMGDPVLVEVGDKKVWTCCPACPPKLEAEPDKYLARLAPPPEDEVLSVPESAVIDTGTRKVVYVEVEPGVFEGREVVLGPRTGNRFPILDGLALGQKVAASGAFLIDAESRINTSGGSVPSTPPSPEASGDGSGPDLRSSRSADSSRPVPAQASVPGRTSP